MLRATGRVCSRCRTIIESGRKFCPNCGLLMNASNKALEISRDAPIELKIADYALESDLAASSAVDKITLLPRAVDFMIRYWQKPITRARLLGDGVRVNERQISSIYRIFDRCAAAIGTPLPELFIKQDPTFNAYTIGTNDDAVIVLHSALVDALKSDELSFVISHELGHVKSRHVTYLTVARFLGNGIVSFASALAAPLTVALHAWAREAELTADRAGLIGCGNISASLRAILMLALGSRRLLSEVSLQEFVLQDDVTQDKYGRLNLWLGQYDHPYLSSRARALVDFASTSRAKQLSDMIQRQLPAIDSVMIDCPAETVAVQRSTGNSGNTSRVRRFCACCGCELMETPPSSCPICGER